MRTVGDLLSLVPGLNHDEISNYRRGGYLNEVRAPNARQFVFPDRDVLHLRFAKPLIDDGVQPARAFKRAAERYIANAQAIRDFVSEFAERRNGIGPISDDVQRELRGKIPDPLLHLQALVEDRELASSGSTGQLSLMSVFKPTTMLAYSDQRRLASEVLSDDQRLRLRELAFDKYRDVTRSLPAQHRLPAPLDFIEREGVVVQRRVLAPGQGGYNDPDSRTIYLSNDIHKNSPWERLVLAHEYWHLVLGHSSESNSKRTELLEAEATYAAIHYLIPVHTFGIIAKQIERRFDSARKRHRSLAETYAVPETVISQYQGEFV